MSSNGQTEHVKAPTTIDMWWRIDKLERELDETRQQLKEVITYIKNTQQPARPAGAGAGGALAKQILAALAKAAANANANTQTEPEAAL